MATGYRPDVRVPKWRSTPTTAAHLCPGNPAGGAAATGPLARVLTILCSASRLRWGWAGSASSLPRRPHTLILGGTPQQQALASPSP